MKPSLRTIAMILALAGSYFCAGKLGLSWAYVHASVTAVWPPTGIALAALLLWGYRLWPGIFLGAFLVNITTQGSVATTLGIAAGNTLEALLAAWAINRFANGAKAFERARNIFRFVLLAPVLSTVVSATLGVISLTLTGFAPWDRFTGIWLTWWLGDAVGDLIVAPLIVIWATQPYPQIKTYRVVEALGLLLSLILVAYLVFFRGIASSAEYIVVLPLLWAAFRFGQRGAVTSAFMISVIALVGTATGGGPFAYANPNESLLHLQAFMGTMAVASLVLASVISEGKRAEQRLQVQDAVSRILAESPALKDAAPQIVRVLCERAGWDFGAIWNIGRDDELHCVEVWHMPSIRVSRFEAITKERSFRRGVGLPGRVWNNGKSAWIADITTDGNFPRAPVALEDGLHGAFGFPIKLADEVLGVIECFSREVREPDDHFLQMVSDLGAQLGQFIERKRAENEIAALNKQMTDDLKAMSRLQDLSTRLVQTHEMGSLMHDILDVAIEIAAADMGNVQLFERGSGALKIVAQRGFETPFLEFFSTVNDGAAACGRAMRLGERIIVEDVAASPIFAESPAREIMLSAGARAVQSTPLFSRSGHLVGMFSTHYRKPYCPTERQLALLDLLARQAADFIERTQTEDRLLQSEERLRAVVDTAVDGIITIDEEGTIITVNPAAEQIFAYQADEMIGQNVRMLMPEGYRNEHASYISNYLRTGERKVIGIGREVEGRRKDGEIIPLDLGISESRVGERRIFTGIVRDITERKRNDELLRQAKDELIKTNEELERRVRGRTADLEQANNHLLKTIDEQKKLEEQLRQAQKMEIIGTLAGGIAHDFNNILNIIRGYVTLISLQTLTPHQISESLKIIDREVERGASVVRQLLTVARKTETQLAPTRANDIVLTLSELIKQTFPKTITVTLDLDPRLPFVLADSNQMSQALLNICVNARDAMSTGGKLIIRTELIDAGNEHERPVGADATFYACIVISDTGIGMDENVRVRIFEPFFTTKGVGEGTGLGLAIVYGIVKEHNGFIEVKSNPGHGATFRLGLPIFQAEGKSAGDDRMRSKSAGRHHADNRGTVLVVEDEEAMVHLLRKLLPQAGYRILVAMDGQEAIDLYHDHKDEIDVVLLDLGLPKVTGFDVIQNLKEQNPAVRIIITTGYLGADLKSELFRAGVKDCIHKPYLIDDVVEKLGSLIEKA